MTNAEYLARYLQVRGVTHVHELIGGMITFLLDAIRQHSDIKIISMHHEQGAAFAAEGWARMKGIPGVALATSGPGATNLLTGIGSCYFDSVPAVFITGQVNRHEQKGDRKIRQLGFQETDIVSMAKPITKGAWLVSAPESLPELLDRAFDLASKGRPGPVLIDIPMDVQRFVLPATTSVRVSLTRAAPNLAEARQRTEFLQQLGKALHVAQRPLVLAGGGLRSGGAIGQFREWIRHLKIPAVHSLMGVDVLPSTDPRRIGMIGSYGNRWANQGFARSDLILVLGSRMDIRQTGSDVAGFRGGRQIFHIDCDSGELNNRVQGCQVWNEELLSFLSESLPFFPQGAGYRPEWEKELQQLRSQSPDTQELAAAIGINPNAFMHQMSQRLSFATAFVSDVGQHQMWSAQSLDLKENQRFLTSGGMGAMGFGLPAAIGASLATGPVVVISGDGGIQLNIQELQTIVRNRLPVKIVILNNHCHGMVRQFQESYFKGRYQSTVWGYTAPDFVKLAIAYGIEASRLTNIVDMDAALHRLAEDPTAAYLLEVDINESTNVYPKLAFGRGFGEMEPDTKPVEIEGT